MNFKIIGSKLDCWHHDVSDPEDCQALRNCNEFYQPSQGGGQSDNFERELKLSAWWLRSLFQKELALMQYFVLMVNVEIQLFLIYYFKSGKSLQGISKLRKEKEI